MVMVVAVAVGAVAAATGAEEERILVVRILAERG
jgi:hypothetical protein